MSKQPAPAIPLPAAAERPSAALRIVYCGMRGAFSLPPLRSLLAAGYPVAAVVLPGLAGRPAVERLEPAPRPALSVLPLLSRPVAQSIVELAWERGIPVLAINALGSTAALAALAALEPDLGVVACFSRRIPPALLRLPRHGFLNIHPSLLPRYRGPAPVFWALRDGAPLDVTLHRMDAQLDTGPIVAQAPVAAPDGADGPALDRLLAERGAELLLAALPGIERSGLRSTPQPDMGTAAPWPTAADFAIDPSWSARRAFNFMRGTAEWQQPYPVTLAGHAFHLIHALGFDPEARLDAPFEVAGRTLRVQCTPGVLEATTRE